MFKDAAVESLTTVKPYSNEIHAQAQLWLKKDPKASYEAWKKCLPARGKYCDLVKIKTDKSNKIVFFFFQQKRTKEYAFYDEVYLDLTGQEAVPKPQGKAELRKQYLMEKYSWKWKQFMRSRKGEGLFPRLLKLSHNNWLRQVTLLFIHSYK